MTHLTCYRSSRPMKPSGRCCSVPAASKNGGQIVTLLEARGFPKIDHLMGGRYVRAVIDFFDNQYGLNRGGASPLAPDGVEDFEKWRQRQKRHS
jgi:hypothetical protein